MLLQCPECNESAERVGFEGWVLKVNGTIELNEMEQLSCVGPLTAVTTIGRGKELTDCYEKSFICMKCLQRNPASTFKRLFTCALTNTLADTTILTVMGNLHINSDFLSEAQIIFQEQNMLSWRIPF